MSTEKAGVFLVRAVTPVHIGVDAGLGAVNLPTMRESVTKHPVLPGSSFKGVLRDLLKLHDNDNAVDQPEGRPRAPVDDKSQERWAAFGPGRSNASDYRGGLVLSDARLLFLPIPSLKGTFAWITSRGVLLRHERELRELQLDPMGVTPTQEPDTALVGRESKLLFGQKQVALREMLTNAQDTEQVDKLAKAIAPDLGWPLGGADAEFFRQRVAMVPDSLFDAFARTALELRARVAINHTRGTAEDSGPWTEEHVPAGTIFAGVVLGRQTGYVAPVRSTSANARREPRTFSAEKMLDVFKEAITEGGLTLRIGGHSSVGLGRVRITRSRGLQ